MQWDNSLNAGFTGGKPWINVCDRYVDINAECQFNDPNSILNYTKK